MFLQEAALSVYATRLDRHYYGASYEEWVKQCKNMQSWARADVEAWQSSRLLSLLALAATRVPYYHEAWRNVNWKSVRSAAELSVLPRLEKQSIRQNELDFIIKGTDPKSLWMDKTSGTTGTALRIYQPMSMLPIWWALTEVMVRNVAGVGQQMPRAMMGGRPVVRGSCKRPPYWRFNRHWRQLYMSSYHVSSETAPYYVGALRKYGSQWITGYGSAIAALAENAMEAGLSPFRFHAVIVSGDTLLSGMRSSIEQFFQCKCYDHYGQSERVCMAMECSQGRMHVSPVAGILEILREDGSTCAPGEVGEIVATGLLNDVMPLIRYRLGDFAAWAKEQNCPCGNPSPTITKVEGRLDDYLITRDGRKIGRLSTAIKRSPTIHSAQIVQDQLGHAYLFVRPGQGYASSDAIAVRNDILERIGAFNLEVVEVSEIPKTLQGKTVLVVNLSERPNMREIYAEILKEVGVHVP